MKIIPYGRQYIDNNDIQAVSKTLKKKLITSGEETIKFEKKINSFLDCKYSATCNSGTSAIYLSFLAINLKKNDNIIMPSINFISSYNIAKLIGANVYLADVDRWTGQMTPQNVEDCCKKFKIRRAKVIVTMYNGGYPQNVEKFFKLKKKLNCYIIEDACHALGAEYKYKNEKIKIGSCLHSDISTFSLHPLKTITTGEGGIVTTNSKKLDYRIKKYRSLGIKRFKNKHWSYDVTYTGLNFRMNEFQSALGISQLKKIKRFIKSRKRIAIKYTKELKKISEIKVPNHLTQYSSSFHLYLINLVTPNYEKKEELIKFMKKNKIILQYHYIPIYKFKIFKGKHLSKNAELYFKSTISLPIFHKLSLKEHNYIINKLNLFFNN
ncbi:DegT/DnrJ/EryC1/StrS family aminotransferase [Candidatus Pelagibacter sp.]|nr:DegT/DnrJ/EryC1/StrS family aminotransferase [Candidatus Pelagibacter sp.]